MPFAQHGVRQPPLLPDDGKHQFQRRFLVGQQALDRGIVHPLERMDAADLFQAFGHQLFGDAPPERVEPLDLPGLDGELPAPFAEVDIQRATIRPRARKLLAQCFPALHQLGITQGSPFFGAVRHTGKGFPRDALRISNR